MNLDDILFKYGARLNYSLLQDLQANPIRLVINEDGAGQSTKQMLFPWPYHPILSHSNEDHPITKNMGPIMSKFCGTIDTVNTKGIKKTILLLP